MADPFLAIDLRLPSSRTSHRQTCRRTSGRDRGDGLSNRRHLASFGFKAPGQRFRLRFPKGCCQAIASKGLRPCKVAFTPTWLSANCFHTKVCTVLALPRIPPSLVGTWLAINAPTPQNRQTNMGKNQTKPTEIRRRESAPCR